MTDPITNPPQPYSRPITPLQFSLEFTLNPSSYLAYCKEEGETPDFDKWMDWAIEDAQDYINREGEMFYNKPWGIRTCLSPIEPSFYRDAP